MRQPPYPMSIHTNKVHPRIHPYHNIICNNTYDILLIVNQGGGGGVLHQIFGSQVQHVKKNWTQSDLRFCENEGSKRSKINEKEGQLD